MVDEASPLALRLTPQAERDLEAVWFYTADTWSVAQADRYVGELADTFDLICHNPMMARERLEFTPPVRLHRHASHLIVYRSDETTVLVIRVLHMKQDWRAALDEPAT
jgi:toxin ParE1/3/4